jgi:hypothetical protein
MPVTVPSPIIIRLAAMNHKKKLITPFPIARRGYRPLAKSQPEAFNKGD